MSTREALRDAAVAYARLGWRVVPVKPGEKRPSDGVGWQKPAFARSPDELSRAWTEPFNVGVMLGEESVGLVDVDLDCAEALEFAPEYLPPGAFVFGRPTRPRSHWLYRALGAHLIQLKDLARSMIVELRAKPAGGEGAQTLLPPSIHPSGEVVTWDEDSDATELPAVVDAAALISAVRSVAVAAFLARQLGSTAAARAYLTKPLPGNLSYNVARHVRDLAGLPAIQEPRSRRPTRPELLGGSPFSRLREAGISRTAALLGLEWDDRRRALVNCPACRADMRSTHDRRPAAGVLVASDSGRQLWTHGKCGHTGDAVSLAAATLLGTLRPSTSEEWSKLAAALREQGWE